ncbi:permease prefix domain 1-containing protein [Kineothrix sedimenti]|uniref:Permease prefix domain 1-containing protein n=1 Tax=Kineothrix sedimenti TaxID=3123317 RepID=A0ABZ3ESD9_9FIRM
MGKDDSNMVKEKVSNELIERYLYDVVRRLPEKQRDDIEQELRSLIEDMIEEREGSGELSREECERAVLTGLGDPAKMARSYRGDKEGLISGEYYDRYCYILKIVLICAGAAILFSDIISAMVHVVSDETLDIISGMGYALNEGLLSSSTWWKVFDIGITLPSALLQIFGVITLIFALMQRYHVKLDLSGEAWSVEKLPQIPYKKAMISRGESAVGIVFGVLAIILFAYSPQLMGAWVRQGEEMVSIPLFNLSIWGKVLPFFIISVMAGIISDFVKLVAGRYNYRVMVTTIVMDIIGFIMTFIFMKVLPIWNVDFMQALQRETGIVFSSEGDLLIYFNTDSLINGIVIVILFFFLLDIATTVYHTVRYGNKN